MINIDTSPAALLELAESLCCCQSNSYAAFLALRAVAEEKRAQQCAASHPPTMQDAIAAGDGTLHGAIDYWQERALKAELLQQALPLGVIDIEWERAQTQGLGRMATYLQAREFARAIERAHGIGGPAA